MRKGEREIVVKKALKKLLAVVMFPLVFFFCIFRFHILSIFTLFIFQRPGKEENICHGERDEFISKLNIIKVS